jgi:putative redox protein
MVEIRVRYEGDLRCEAEHGPSGTKLPTDPPVDNEGRGESFSPTDLLATSLATCMVTTMGIVARREGWAMEGTTARVVKGMVADPERRIGRLDVELRVAGDHGEEARAALERAARRCPVALSIAPGIEVPLEIVWGD